MPGPLPTTTIGSLPRFEGGLEEALEASVEYQKTHGMDILTDGEQRTDMISYFAEAFGGLEVRNGFPTVTGKIILDGSPDEFSKVRDLDHLLRKYPGIRPKVAITGPTTIGMTCASRRIESYYSGLTDPRLYDDIAAALAPVAKAIVSRGAYLQIDEPFLSQGYRDLEARVALIDRVAEDLPAKQVSVHVCGHIGRFGVVKYLLNLDRVSVVSLAFAGHIEAPNIDHVDGKGFADHEKKLGAGCISVTPMSEADVQTPEQVRTKLSDMAGKIGRENIAYAHPDCGLRATKKELVPIILSNLRAGVDLFG